MYDKFDIAHYMFADNPLNITITQSAFVIKLLSFEG